MIFINSKSQIEETKESDPFRLVVATNFNLYSDDSLLRMPNLIQHNTSSLYMGGNDSFRYYENQRMYLLQTIMSIMNHIEAMMVMTH